MMLFLLLIAFSVGFCGCEHDNVHAPELFDSPYEYIIQHMPERFKVLVDKYLENGTSHELIDYFAPIQAKDKVCRNQSLLYKSSFKNFQPWALKMWDSSGKLPSGIFERTFYEFGNYHECLNIPRTGPYEVKYCIIEVKNLFPSPVYHTEFMKSKSFLFGGLQLVKENLYLAQCVPATCNNDDLEYHYTSIISELNISIEIGKYSCTTSNENEPFSILDWIAILFLTLSIFLMTIATIVHTFLPKDSKKGVLLSLLLCFSIYLNSYQILTRDNLKSKLSFLSGLRGLAMMTIMIGHISVCLISIPISNFLSLSKNYSKPSLYYALVCTFHLSVDVFFITGGLLLSYLQIQNRKLGRKFSFKFYYFRRAFRIYPPYISQILLYITLLYRYAGSGPIWKTFMGPVRENCLKNWWTNLLFINNYVHKDEQCIPTNWYLAVDMQLYIVGPLFLFLLMKSKTFRIYGVPFSITVCNLWMFFNSYVNEYRAGSLVDMSVRTERTNQNVYIATPSRFPGWLLGLCLGYYLHQIEDKPKKQILSKVTLWVGWSLTILVQIQAFLSMYYLMAVDEHVNFFDSLYNGFNRTVFALSICWLIYACKLGYGGYLYKFLSWYPLQVMGKLTFTAYLSQMLILLGIDSTITTTLQHDGIFLFRETLSNIIICFVFSFFLSILFELPYSNLGRVLTTDKKNEGVAAEKIDEEKCEGLDQRNHKDDRETS